MQTIQCADCGAERTTRWKNTRYCALCRLYRDLQFLGTRTQKCAVCQAKYSPAKASHMTCAKCALSPREMLDGEQGSHPKCKVCQSSEFPQYMEGLDLCTGCLLSPDPKVRAKITAGLAKRIAQDMRAREGAEL